MQALIYAIAEHQSFGLDDIKNALKDKDASRIEKFFHALEDFAKNENNRYFLGYKSKNKLKAKNYVGIIQTKYGTLEILPKCFEIQNISQEIQKHYQPHYTKEELQKHYQIATFQKQDFDLPQAQNSIQSGRHLLIAFLKTLKKLPFKHSQTTALHTDKLPLLDIFIQNFCKEFKILCQKGICHDYVSTQDNHPYLKGKLLFKEQISHNLIHKERFFTQSDAYLADIAQNRIIKSTLLFLKTKVASIGMHFELQKCLEIFEEIPPSYDINQDFKQCKSSRHFAYYERILSWCKIFLQNRSFAPYGGKDQNFALLFAMEKLFESYVATMLIRNNPNLSITLQSQKQFLIRNKEERLFALKPDIVIKDKGVIKILDTKWKILNHSSDERKYGISQNDLYQMWAYACAYEAREVWIIYPLCEKTKALYHQTRQMQWHFDASRHLSFCQDQSIKSDADMQVEFQGVQVRILFAPLEF